MIPHSNFHTGLSEVLGSESVIHHGVVEHWVSRPLHHSRLLSAFSASVRKYSATAEGHDGEMHLFIQMHLIKRIQETHNIQKYHFTNGSMISPLTAGRFLQSFTQICTSPVSILDVLLPVDAAKSK